MSRRYPPLEAVEEAAEGEQLEDEMLTKGVELFLFFLAQLLSKEDKPRVLTVVDCEENLVDAWLVRLARLVDVIQGIHLLYRVIVCGLH